MSIKEEVTAQARRAKEASRELAGISTDKKNKALQKIAERLENSQDRILKINQKDMEKGKKKGLSRALLDRLKLTEERINKMAAGLRDIVGLEDPIGEVTRMWKRPNDLHVGQIRVPLGVIGIIYEARPNVTVDVAGLCLKAGNAVLLRGGSNAFRSNQILTTIISEALEQVGLPQNSVELVQTTDRKAVEVIFGLNEYLDVLIPRGGAGLIKRVVEESSVPAIQTGVGNCHVYVDQSAEIDMALNIIDNAKTDRPAVCNAAETLLVHEEIAPEFLPRLKELFAGRVELRGCEQTREIIPGIKPAEEEDWYEEYLDYILAVRVVDSIEQAIDHIFTYGSMHSEAIVTENYTKANQFLEAIDAAAVYVNASTRFTDGGQFGLGAETGISTQKLHARGPMGLKELTTTKYIIRGKGQVRE
ncbi:MAG: glutamate-5-semialdehyde dehydrogenase [Halanaerobiaceae bacterium]